MIYVENLSKSFGNVRAVQDGSFSAPDGLITGLLGPNGAGKSTTMRLIAGALEPDSGMAEIDGFDPRSQRLDAHNMILDEPTAGLDVMSTRAMRGGIRQLRDEGRCILFTSHVMQEVAMLCDNIVIIAGGRVAAQGSPDELRQRTGQENLEDAFVAIIGTKEGLI